MKPTNASYKTGYAFNASGGASRNDGNMLVNYNASGNMKRGYVVFNLGSVLPTASTVTSATFMFKIIATANSANPAVSVKGYAGDMSTITNADSVYAKCDLGSAFSATTTYGGATGWITLTLNSTAISFFNANTSGNVTLCFSPSSNAGQTYTIAGYSVDSTAPLLTLNYTCSGLGTTTASASPNPVCSTATLSLTGSVTGASTYSWVGPSGSSFTSTRQNPTTTASAASAGVYSFTATNSSGCYYKATTASVTVTPLPSAISGATSMCPSSSTTLTCTPSGGSWSSSVTSVASINSSTGVVNSTASGGTTIISYTTGCGASGMSLAVNSTVGPISGSSSVCVGATTTLTNATGGGTWSSSAPSTATVNPTTGAVFGVAAGSATITYTPICGSYVTQSITVNSRPTISVTPTSGTTCLSASKLLTASGGSSYSWAPATGLSATTG
ncbi:MAG: hypothetical protein EBZ77_14540, partial [Chitinophagia bacterium]|nr:hypothetical protein [Chitinophagia bacterium]